jgi:hypothetical protein
MMNRIIWGTLFLVCIVPVAVWSADKPIFSGPQMGEKLASFKVKGIYDDDAGKELDYIKQSAGKTLFVVFFHERTRPAFGVTKTLMEYAATRKKDGLFSAIVFLPEDKTETESWLKRVRSVMPKKTPIGISVDGKEGPGSYGLNRNVALTILVAKNNKVTANFALVQPSVQADVPQVLKAVVKQIGGKVPTLAQLGVKRYRRKAGKKNEEQQDPNLRGLISPIIQKTATPEEVEKAVFNLEKFLFDNPKSRLQVGDIARRIIKADKLEDYGTKRAQEYLPKWAKEYKLKARSKKKRKGS